MKNSLSITLDIGTTNSKVSLFEIATGLLVEREVFRTYKKQDSFGELFDFEIIWKDIKQIIEKLIKKYPNRIDSINISSVGEAGVLINEEGDIKTPLITWYDTRASKYIEGLNQPDKELIYKVTGLPAHSNYSLPKIKWLVDNLEISGKFIWLNIPDLICFLLTGEMKTEYSMASRTLAFDIQKKEWSNEVLDLFDLTNIVCFPDVIGSGEIAGFTDGKNAEIFCNEHISVRISGHDHMVGALGIGLTPNELLNSTGTTEGVLLIDEKNLNNEEHFQKSLSNGIFTDSEYYTLFSSMPTGGNIFSWYQNCFDRTTEELKIECQKLLEDYEDFNIDLEDSLLVVPHWNGSGAPFKSSNSKGLIYGLTIETKPLDILFGVVLGLVLEMKNSVNCFPLDGINEVIVIGPAINNPLWLQMKSDILNKPIRAVDLEEAVSFGALKSSYPDFVAVDKFVTYYPSKKRNEQLEKLYKEYLKIYSFKNTLVN